MHIILFDQNRSQNLSFFTKCFAEALRKKGCQYAIFNADTELNHYFSFIKKNRPTCTFAFIGKRILNSDFCLSEETKIPHFAYCVDHFFYSLPLFKIPTISVGVIDQEGIPFFSEKGFSPYFFPHASDTFLKNFRKEKPLYDVLMIGRCFDYERIKRNWETYLPEKLSIKMKKIAEVLFQNPTLSFTDVFLRELTEFDFSFEILELLFSQLENYLRGKERVHLIRSLKSSRVYVFGDQRGDGEGWSHYLKNYPHVYVKEGRVCLQDMLHLTCQSRIYLNSTPSFRHAGHERIFNGLMLNSLVLTNENTFTKTHFKDEENILLYKNVLHGEPLDEKVFSYLSNEEKRVEVLEKGKKIVEEGHTWDHRVETFLSLLPSILLKVKENEA